MQSRRLAASIASWAKDRVSSPHDCGNYASSVQREASGRLVEGNTFVEHQSLPPSTGLSEFKARA